MIRSFAGFIVQKHVQVTRRKRVSPSKFGADNPHQASYWGFRRSRTLSPKGSRTAFRDDPEHHGSVATLASRLCKKVFGFVNKNRLYPERSGGRRPHARMGVRGKGRQSLARPHHTEPRSAISAPAKCGELELLVGGWDLFGVVNNQDFKRHFFCLQLQPELLSHCRKK